MELWVRSQDKEKLVLTKGFETQHTNYDGGCQIFAVWQNNYQMVGKYKTKERALEVLEEIQKLLTPQVIVNPYKIEQEKMIDGNSMLLCMNKIEDFSIKEFSSYVYEMPKK